MCLTSITKEYADNDVEGIGYKIFRISNEGISNEELYSPIFGFEQFEYNNWYHRRIYFIYITDTITYDSGFHIFPNKEDCYIYAYEMGWSSKARLSIQYKIVKVKYKGVLYEGLQNNLKCLVVKSIMLLDETI
jgi:hypothetical protein